MADFRATLGELGATNPRTNIASSNAVVDTARTLRTVQAILDLAQR